MFGSPEPHALALHDFGRIVGKKLSIVQYRWLRRRFKAVGTTLSLVRNYPQPIPRHRRPHATEWNVVVDKSGRFDFAT